MNRKRRYFYHRSFAVFLLMAMFPKLGLSLWEHALLHHTSSEISIYHPGNSHLVSSCHCLDDVITPMDTTAFLLQHAHLLSAKILLQKISFPSQTCDFENVRLRGPPIQAWLPV